VIRPRWTGAVGGLAAWLLGGCNTVQSALAPAGDQALAIGRVWDLMLWICTAMYLLVLLAVGWALLRRRREGAPMVGERTLSMALVAFVVLTVGLLTAMTAASYVTDRRLHARVDDPVEIRITAKQWWWQVQYLDADPSKQFTTANELHLPVDRPARIELRTSDVIHSLWVPVLNGKEDMIPGHANTIVMTPRRIGRYRGQCAEFCGLQHAKMALDVQVDSASAFDSWRRHQLQPAAAPTTATARAGQQLFTATACASCHAITGTTAGSLAGPDLTHMASRHTLAAGALPLNRGTLQAWIIDPQLHKPGNHMPAVPLQPRQLADLTDYLMGLR
jgi:cytochrome c oxidase subunit II